MSDLTLLPSSEHRTAEISDCGRYRYRLTRTWDASAPPLGWVMLNPSTADATVDDPTIRRCTAFAKADGFGGITVANLFAWRATQPSELLGADDPFGFPRNVEVLEQLFVDHHVVVAAWGAKYGDVRRRRALSAERYGGGDHPKMVRAMANRHGAELVCLGTTKDGSPKHPLYVAAAQPFVPWGLAS